MKNFKRPENEQPFYYSTTVECGEIVHHDGDPAYAVYLSEIEETRRRANLWHAWLDKHVKRAYNGLGVVKPEIYAKHQATRDAFMNGELS